MEDCGIFYLAQKISGAKLGAVDYIVAQRSVCDLSLRRLAAFFCSGRLFVFSVAGKLDFAPIAYDLTSI